MNTQNIELIQNKIEKIRNKKKKIFFKGLKTYNYSKFKAKCKNVKFVLNSIEQLSKGYI